MDTIPEHFKIKLDPVARPDAIVRAGNARFTVLTSQMIRMEWSPTGQFEERASQAFWFRTQPVPAFTTEETGGALVIDTGDLRLTYQTGEPFSARSLAVDLKDLSTTWRYGDPDPGNLRGTARTVDNVDGAAPLGLGLVSRSGWSLVDDSSSLVFNDVGWLEARNAPAGQLDLYFLGYGHDYLGCLRDFNTVSGVVPMIPRFILGNWWSRYWEYSQAELTQLMQDFQAHQVPLSVCIIDMDWHITKTGNKSSGWTGYTWNRSLFPDPEGQLRFLHDQGLKVALNLHPAEGVHPHEEMYAEMAEAVGMAPEAGEPVEFDITNPRFVEAYFRILHHPQEARGIDFWWMDWQQGVRTRLSGLDPLWWLNHLHFLDLGRDGKRRSFIFSRWGGLGNHRYPIGFSGDSVVSWASLAFQPYFTATSSNVNYGWWSHDIGGHMSGIEDSELYTRWVQLGAFLPVLRLHSTKNAYHDRRPWGFDANTLSAARAALQLRHAMIPYLYSMAWRFHSESIPPLTPMYYPFPEQDEAYACPNQYLYGSQLLVAPFISPKDNDTRLSRAVAWLPEHQGGWYGYFDGQYYPAGWQPVYGTLEDIPVFASAGAIIPTGPMAGWGNIDVPEHLFVHVFPGADGSFELYEDEGNSMHYLEGEYAVTPLAQKWSDKQTVLTIGPAVGQTDLLPSQRQVTLLFRGFNRPDSVEVRVNGALVDATTEYQAETHTLAIQGLSIDPASQIEVRLSGAGGLANQDDYRLPACLRLLQHGRIETGAKAILTEELPQILQDPSQLGRYLAVLTPSQLRAFMEIITGAGMDYTTSTGTGLLVAWNNRDDSLVTFQHSLAHLKEWWHYKERHPWTGGVLPRFLSFTSTESTDGKHPWVASLNYYGVAATQVAGK